MLKVCRVTDDILSENHAGYKGYMTLARGWSCLMVPLPSQV